MTEIRIQELTMDSRQVKPGDLFIAVPGLTVDGRDYIQNALKQGAAAVLVEENSEVFSFEEWRKKYAEFNQTVPIIPVSSLKKIVSVIAARFFNEPSQKLSVIGVTGTNGKTSTTHYIAQILGYCGKQCAVMGSLGAGFLGQLQEISYATPDAITVQRKLADFQREGAIAAAMEVSSHALDQYRVSGVHFKTAIFTNLTRDHLDYHPSLEAYAEAKQKLFCAFEPKYSVINLEDEQGRLLVNKLSAKRSAHQIIGYTTRDDIKAAISTRDVILSEAGISAFIKTPWGEGELQCGLLGKFNLSNLLAAIAAVCLEGLSLAEVLSAVKVIKPALGRMMRLGGKGEDPLVVLDYAHTPDALQQVLTALRSHCRGKLWCVFGCGGDRDRGKRSLMAAVAENLSDYICITQDNPRTEDPNQIMSDMIKGLKKREKAFVEPDRRLAIQATIEAANSEDCVLVAGKGHENYQIIGTKKNPFSDQTEIEIALERKRG